MLKNYLMLSFKVLARRKFFTFISFFGISFTLLVLMVVTAMLDHTFAPRPPESRLDRTLGIFELTASGQEGSITGPPGYGFLEDTALGVPGAERVTIYQLATTAVSFEGGRRIESQLKRTDSEFWAIHDFEFLEGGPFAADDDRNGNQVAVINETTRRRFFGSSGAVGQDLTLDKQTFRVVGVVRDVPVQRDIPFADVWVPLSTNPSSEYRHHFLSDCSALILAPSRRDLPALEQELAARVAAVESPDPKLYPVVEAPVESVVEYRARQLLERDAGEISAARLRGGLLLGALLFMILPAVNLMNINLSRILERSSEIGIRKSFGAAPQVLLGQFIVENLVLTLIGGLLGAALSWLALDAINRSGIVPYSDFGLNLRVFFIGLGLAVVFAFLSGVVPAWRMSRLDPIEALGRAS